jgi:hypothetical protein
VGATLHNRWEGPRRGRLHTTPPRPEFVTPTAGGRGTPTPRTRERIETGDQRQGNEGCWTVTAKKRGDPDPAGRSRPQRAATGGDQRRAARSRPTLAAVRGVLAPMAASGGRRSGGGRIYWPGPAARCRRAVAVPSGSGAARMPRSVWAAKSSRETPTRPTRPGPETGRRPRSGRCMERAAKPKCLPQSSARGV